MRDANKSLNVYMSEIEYNQEPKKESPMHNVLTVRAAVPLTRLVDGHLEFRGILIINLDLETAVRNLTDAARHLVFLGTGEASGLEGANGPRLLYDPKFQEIQDPTQKKNNSEKASPFDADDFEDILRRDINNCAQFNRELTTIFSVTPERAERGSSNDSVLPFEDRGQRFPNDTLAGNRLTLNPAHQFYLIKLDLAHPADPVVAADFRTKLSEQLLSLRSNSNSIRMRPLVRPGSGLISIRAAQKRELMNVVDVLENLPSHEGRVSRRYDEPALCANFAAHFYRVYFDPARPQRYLALLVGFSDEELTADLSNTRTAAFRTFFIATFLGGAVFLLFLWWFVTRPIHQLTRASESIAHGDYDTQLPTKKRDEIGTLSRTFAIMVNEVRARDAEIREQNEELDGKVRKRTASLAETRDQLQAAVKARDAFLATVSHELRTPLNHIYGYAQLLEVTDLDEEQRSDLAKLQGSSRHLLRLVKDILDYQKIIMGRLPVSPATFDITTLLSSVRESNQSKAEQRNNRLVLQMNGHEGRLFNDENRLRQILDNLVGNACKFNTDGTITIDVKAEGDFFQIAIVDTGVGISQDQIGKLFQPFSKVSDGALNPDGTGLGLVISRELARKMGGDLTVSSVPGQGSSFSTRILREMPATDGDDERLVIQSDTVTVITELKPKDETVESQRQSSNHVLVIDDDPNVRELLSWFLTEEGLQVITASGGTDGIELAARHTPSVITLDLIMPDIDGWSVLAALKASERTANIPVVLVTVLDDSHRGYYFGAADYVSKPIEGDRLKQVVRRYCGNETSTVLIIDDNPKDREIVRRVLQNDGCRIVEATDGADGLKKFEKSPTDLIILDLVMPVMDGFTFIEEIRRRTKTEMPPIIVLTAKEMTAENRNRLHGMVSEVIQKSPFDRRRFVQEIHRQLDNVRRLL
ncbi:MAG: response regulator [Fuerstiella sp.]